MVHDRSRQPHQRRQLDHVCHHLDTIRQEKTTRETRQVTERRHEQIVNGHDSVEYSASMANVEAQYDDDVEMTVICAVTERL